MASNERSDEADADAAGRACAWAEKLDALGRRDEARQVLVGALDDRGGPAQVARTLASIEAADGAPDRAVERLQGILDSTPDDHSTAKMLIDLLLARRRPDEAEKMIAGVLGWRANADLRELAGRIYREQGKHAEAVDAFGPRRSLSRRGRKMRRRSWWRSAGPLRHRVPWLAIPEGRLLTRQSPRVSEPFDAMLEAITWAKQLSEQARHEDARRAVSEALATHGRHWHLLRCAAEIESAAKAWNTALWFWREAHRQVPGDVDVVCDLAMCLARIVVEPSYAARTYDAFQLIDDFPGQNEPRIRAARADLLEEVGASSARIAAACGRTSVLRRYARSLRRRSAGPLGQLAVRIVDRLRGGRPVPTASSWAPRIESESEPIARVLDEADALSPSAAREHVEQAMSAYGRQPSLLLAGAEAARRARAHWQCVSLTAEAVRNDPENLDAVCSLAEALYFVGFYGTALQVINNLPASTRDRPEVRGVVGDLHRYARNFALAVSGYGDPRLLERFHKKERRRCVRKALVQRLTSRRKSPAGGIDLTILDLLTPAVAEALDLRSDDRTKEERPALIRAAIREHGRNPWLLLALASSETVGHMNAALATEAMHAAPENPLIVADGIRQLWFTDDAATLRMIGDLSEKLLDSPEVREIAGTIFRFWKLYGHSVNAYGRAGITGLYWERRRESWRRSGGPVGGVRDSVMALESNFLRTADLAEPQGQAAELAALSPTRAVAQDISEDLAEYRLRRALNTTLVPALSDLWFVGANQLISVLCAGFAIYACWRRSSAGILDLVGETALALAALALVLRRAERRAVQAGLLAGMGCAGGVLLLVPRQEQPLGIGLAAIMFLTISVTSKGLRPIVNILPRQRAVRWRRREAEVGILDALLGLLSELREAGSPEKSAVDRRRFVDDLEGIAVMLERDLPFALGAKDPGSQRAIAAHARSAADVVRRVKMSLALPTPAAQREAVEVLNGLASALVSHDFDHWPTPPVHGAKHQPPLPPWKQAERIGRTALVIAVPALAAFVLPLFLPINGTGLPWFRFASIVWAVLGIVVALDPAWSERIAKMREGLDLLRNATAPGNASSTAAAKNEEVAEAATPFSSRADLARKDREND